MRFRRTAHGIEIEIRNHQGRHVERERWARNFLRRSFTVLCNSGADPPPRREEPKKDLLPPDQKRGHQPYDELPPVSF